MSLTCGTTVVNAKVSLLYNTVSLLSHLYEYLKTGLDKSTHDF